MLSISRRVQFCAGHRVLGHENKCANMHGHNYVALFEAIARNDELDSIGRIVDFSVLKDRIGGWIETNWDHAFLYYKDDLAVAKALSAFDAANGLIIGKAFLAPFNPTAENMARYLLNVVCPTLLADIAIDVVRVTLWETENCCAIADIASVIRIQT